MEIKDLMGQIVTVNKVLERVNRKYRLSNPVSFIPRAGWVVGKRTVYSGWLDYDEYQAVFMPTEKHQCLLVAYWPTMNPVKVPLDGFVLGGKPYPPANEWQESWKDEQREVMKNWPRRSNGQWKAYAELTKEERENLYK